MADMVEIEVTVVVDCDGAYVVRADWDEAHEAANEEPLAPVRRVVVLTVKVPMPTHTEATVVVPEEAAVTPVVTVK